MTDPRSADPAATNPAGGPDPAMTDPAGGPVPATEDGESDARGEGGAGQLRLRPPRHQVDRRAIRRWSVDAALNTLALVAVVAAVTGVIEPIRPLFPWAVGAALVGGAAYTIVMPRIRYRVHRWEVTDEAVYARSGWLTHEWRVAPLSRVQTVDARRSPLDQVFGLSSVRVTTASASGDVSIDGLDHLLAADLVEALTSITQATPGDAT
jgi:membrane protein YdbS with pleckstrin-like domain